MIKDEKELCNLFEKYLKHRESLPPLKEEDPSQDWSHLTEEEKENRKKADEEKSAADNAKKEEEKKASDDAYAALDDLGKANADWNKKVDEMHVECNNRLKISRLSKQQKFDLFQTVRFSFMKHEDLISLTANKEFEMAKDFILEGLSYKLNHFENAIKGELKINTEPRVNYNPSAIPQKAAPTQNPAEQAAANPYLKKTNFENYYERKLHEEKVSHNQFAAKLIGNQMGHHIQDMMQT